MIQLFQSAQTELHKEQILKSANSKKISLLAPVRSGRRPSPEGTRSFSGALLTGIAREKLQMILFVSVAN